MWTSPTPTKIKKLKLYRKPQGLLTERAYFFTFDPERWKRPLLHLLALEKHAISDTFLLPKHGSSHPHLKT